MKQPNDSPQVYPTPEEMAPPAPGQTDLRGVTVLPVPRQDADEATAFGDGWMLRRFLVVR